MPYIRAFCRVAIPQSGLLSQVSSLRFPWGHSGLVLTLSNAARSSLPSPHLLVAVQASTLLLHWGSYRWARNLWGLIIYLFFFLVTFLSEIPRLTTDPPERVFPRIGKLLSLLRLPSWDGSLSPPLLSLFLSFIFCPTSF